MAARGARTAGQDTAKHRLPGREHVVELDPLDQRLRAAFSRARLDRWAHGDDRISLGGRTQRALYRDRGRVCPTQGRCHCHRGWRGPGREAGHADHPHRPRGRYRPARRRLGGEPGASGRQYDRSVDAVVRRRGQAARLAARASARSASLGGHRQRRVSRHRARDRRGSRGRRYARSRSRRAGNPACRGYRGNVPGAQGRLAGSLCVCQPARERQPRSYQHPSARRAGADDACGARFSRGGRFHVLWTEPPAFVPPRGRLRRQDSARGEAGRPTSRAAHELRSRLQPHDRQGARPGDTGHPTRPRRRGDRMRRREFITLLGGAAAWPLAARAQQPDRVRRVGVLMNLAVGDPEGEARIAAFVQALQRLGWSEGRNLRIDYRWAADDAGAFHRYAEELLALAPDVILAAATPSVQALQQATRTVPIVFAIVADPVGAGFVDSLARPGGNATGFTPFEYGISGKWLELLKEIAPRVTRVAVLRDLTIGLGQLGAIQSVAPSLGVELTPISLGDAGQIERNVAAFARSPNGGLIVTASTSAVIHRKLISTLAAGHKLPAVSYERYFATTGGLLSYGPDPIDMYRRAASYVDRILKGEKPADLPVQTPTKYQLVVNLKTAKALGLDIPTSILARADEAIE